jgi:hypothetical protein
LLRIRRGFTHSSVQRPTKHAETVSTIRHKASAAASHSVIPARDIDIIGIATHSYRRFCMIPEVCDKNRSGDTGEFSMTLILSNDDVRQALSVSECLAVMEESYREQAESRAVNRPTTHSYLPHSLPNSTYSFKSVDGGRR